MQNWGDFIFSDTPFEEKTLRVFEYQFENNPVYRRFCEALNYPSGRLEQSDGLEQIPLLPIQAFKDANIITAEDHSTTCPPTSGFNTQQPIRLPADSSLTFKSSGTSGMNRSTHYVADENIYRQSVLNGFRHFYNLDDAVILGYTPGYVDNPHSSLIWMIDELIKNDVIKKSRFLPLDKPLSQGEVDDIEASGRQLIIFGAAFGLLDLIDISSVQLPLNSIVIETGGMKTHRRKMDRQTMHRKLAEGFRINVSRIHSEYGMCELLSQAYATGGKWFRSVPWMQVSVHNPDDPQKRIPPLQEGLIGAMDLANVHSCSFLLTGDRGLMDRQGRFQVLGRWNPKDLRGCNFLIDED